MLQALYYCGFSNLIHYTKYLFREVVSDLKAAGASWIQFDEPTLVLDLDSQKLQAFSDAYTELESTLSGLNVLIETYFADVPAEAYKTLTSLKGVTAYGFDLVRGTKTLDLIKGEFPKGKYLFAGVVDGRNIWANDLAASVSTLQALEGIVGKGTLLVFWLHKMAAHILILSLWIVIITLFFLIQINLWSQPPAHYSTLLLILLMSLSWTRKLNLGWPSLPRKLLK